MKTALTSLALLGAAALAVAQNPTVDPLGRVTQARGVVTVSDGTTVGLAQRGTPFFEGTRFVSSPSGHAELTLDNGCVIRLKPNESIVIRDKVSCDELFALIQPVPGAPVVATGAAGDYAVLAAVGAVLLLGGGGGGSSSSSGSPGSPGDPGVIPVPPVSGQ